MRTFDKTEVYEKEIKPLVDQLSAICKREDMCFSLQVHVRRMPETREGKEGVLDSVAASHEIWPEDQLEIAPEVMASSLLNISPAEFSRKVISLYLMAKKAGMLEE